MFVGLWKYLFVMFWSDLAIELERLKTGAAIS
jgi:hypothetical protein